MLPRALTLSEFSAPRWQVPGPGGPGETLGQAILRANDLDNPRWWIGAAVGILVAYVVLGNVLLIVALRLLNGAAPRLASRARMPVLDSASDLLCFLPWDGHLRLKAGSWFTVPILCKAFSGDGSPSSHAENMSPAQPGGKLLISGMLLPAQSSRGAGRSWMRARRTPRTPADTAAGVWAAPRAHRTMVAYLPASAITGT